MITLEFYGELAEKYGEKFTFHVSNIRKALALMQANFPDFAKHLVDSDEYLQGYEVWKNEENLNGVEQEFTINCPDSTIKVIPVIKGAGANARIIAGVVLVIVGAAGMTFGWFAAGSAWGPTLIMAGVGLIAGGIAEKLTKKVKSPESTSVDDAESYVFSGAANTSRQGAAVRVGYGQMVVGSVVISAGITTTDIPV